MQSVIATITTEENKMNNRYYRGRPLCRRPAAGARMRTRRSAAAEAGPRSFSHLTFGHCQYFNISSVLQMRRLRLEHHKGFLAEPG